MVQSKKQVGRQSRQNEDLVVMGTKEKQCLRQGGWMLAITTAVSICSQSMCCAATAALQPTLKPHPSSCASWNSIWYHFLGCREGGVIIFTLLWSLIRTNEHPYPWMLEAECLFGVLIRTYTMIGCQRIRLRKCGPRSDGEKKLRRQQSPTHNMLFFWMLGIRSKFPPWEIYTNSNAHSQSQTCDYCLREDKVPLFHHASYFPFCFWKESQGSLRLAVSFADSSLKGRMDVSSRQGHQTDNGRREWLWREKGGREKIAGVTASTCSPQLSDQQAPERTGEKKWEFQRIWMREREKKKHHTKSE